MVRVGRQCHFGVLAQLGERLPCTQKVISSILIGSTKFPGSLAQLVERLVYIQDVGGSSPSGPTNLIIYTTFVLSK